VNTFDLRVGLQDASSNLGGDLIFHGGVNGSAGMTISAFGSSSSWSSISLTYTQLTQSLQLGNHLYTVTMDGSTLGGMRVQVSDVPEPSTLALAALGLSGLGLRAWRRRRR
jgi:MYXO-CTERM domain-containing protein